MIYFIFLSNILAIVIGLLKDKKIYSPIVIFNFIWIFSLGLYNLKLSYLQQELSTRTLQLFILNVLGFNLTYLFVSLFKKKKPKQTKRILKYSTDERIKIANIIVIIIFVIEILYSGGFPFIWKIVGSSKIYFDFGIPSIHGAFNGLIICLGAYSFFKKTNDKYLYLIIGILIISRQVLISIVVEAIIFNLITAKKVNYKKYITIGIIVFLLFNVIGNFRSGANTMNRVFQPRPQYINLPSSVKWAYSYITFSISNFNNLVSMTDGNINHGASILNQLVPTALLDVVNVKVKYQPFYLISLDYTTKTSFPEIYLDFGEYGILIYGMLLAIVGNIIYKNMLFLNTEASILNYSVYLHNVIFLFFINMFIYLPIIIQFVYIHFLFVNNDNFEGDPIYE